MVIEAKTSLNGVSAKERIPLGYDVVPFLYYCVPFGNLREMGQVTGASTSVGVPYTGCISVIEGAVYKTETGEEEAILKSMQSPTGRREDELHVVRIVRVTGTTEIEGTEVDLSDALMVMPKKNESSLVRIVKPVSRHEKGYEEACEWIEIGNGKLTRVKKNLSKLTSEEHALVLPAAEYAEELAEKAKKSS